MVGVYTPWKVTHVTKQGTFLVIVVFVVFRQFI